jgi:tetratricopeptide (TPR) repeat protein
MTETIAIKPSSTFFDRFKQNPWLHLAIIVLMPIIIYAQCIKFDYTNFDDNGIIKEKFEVVKNIKNWDTAFKVDAFFNSTGDFYRPVQNLSFMLDAQATKDKDKLWMFHVTNLLIHILTCISLYFFLQLFDVKKYTAFLLTALFSIHPLFASGVAWIPSRGDILIGLLGLQLFITFAKYCKTNNVVYLILHILLFAITLFTKETTVFFPLFFLYYYFFLLKKQFNVKNIVKLIPFGVFWLGIFIFFFILRKKVVAGTGATIDVLGIIPFFKNNPVIPTIIGKFFAPINLSTFPLYDNLSTIIGIVCMLAVIYVTFEYTREKKWAALMGFLWFLLFAIPPTIYRLQNADTFFNYLEHRTYLPAIGLVIIVALFVNAHIDSIKFQKGLAIVFPVLIVAFGVLAWIHCADYKNNFTVNYRAAKLNNPSALAGISQDYLSKGDTTQAIEHINKAISLNPHDAGMFFTRGKLMAKMQNHDAAAQDYSLALTMQPNLVDALLGRSIEYRYQKKYDAAFRDVFRAASIDTANPKIFYSFGNLFMAVNNYNEAINAYTKTISLQPHYAEAFNNRAYAKLMVKDYNGAIEDCHIAKQLMGDKVVANVYNELGYAYRELNQSDSAFYYFNKAITANNKFKEAYFERGKAYVKDNKIDSACIDFKQSLQLGYNDTTGIVKQYCK